MNIVKRLFTEQQPTLRELFPQYAAGKSWSAATKKNYTKSLRCFDAFLDRSARLGDFTDKRIRAFIEWRAESVGRSSVHHDLTNLLAVWRWAAAQGMTTAPKAIPWSELPLWKPEPLTAAEAERVWEVIQTWEKNVATTCGQRGASQVSGRAWWSAMFLLCRDTGRRAEQIAMLKQADVSAIGRWVRFADDDLARREISSEAATAVAELLALYRFQKGNFRLFRRANNIASVWGDLKKIVLAAGLPGETELIFAENGGQS